MIPLNIILIILISIFGYLYFVPMPKLAGVPACVSEGGIVSCSYKVSMLNATNTPCSIRSPSATSSIVHASADIRGAATSSLFMEIGKGSNTGATTTSLGFMTIAANALGTLVSSTTNNADALIISPNNFVNLRFGRPTGYSSGSPGNCEVIFRVIS